MSELAKLTAAPRADVLPGHTLSRFRVGDFAMAEQEFAQRHLATAADAGEGQPERLQDRLLRMAMDDVRNGHFCWGRMGFDARCGAKESLPFLLWLSLRITEPQITRVEAAALITPETEDALQSTVLELMGFDLGPKPEAAPAKAKTPDAPPTGEPSSSTSADAA